jgi:hypothetical protein
LVLVLVLVLLGAPSSAPGDAAAAADGAALKSETAQRRAGRTAAAAKMNGCAVFASLFLSIYHTQQQADLSKTKL